MLMLSSRSARTSSHKLRIDSYYAKQSVELKMPDAKYENIPPNQTGFAKAAVDRCACMKVNRYTEADQSASSALFVHLLRASEEGKG